MDFVSQQIISVLNQKFGTVGRVDDISLGRTAISVTLSLVGEEKPVTLEVHGLEWSTSDGKMNLFFDELVCTDKIWVQEIFRIVGEKTGHVFSFPDSMKTMPLKMLLKKRA